MTGHTLLIPATSNALDHVRWPSEDARTWVKELLHQADGDPDFRAVVLYGSATRNVGEPGDVDLLVIHRDGELRGDTPPFEVDLRVYQEGELDSRIAAADELLGWALRFGVPAFERGHCWARLVARWTGRLPLPSAAVADQRAAQAQRASDGLRETGDEEAANEMRLSALTQVARARLLRAGVFPLSRPELPEQLLHIGEHHVAAELDQLVVARR